MLTLAIIVIVLITLYLYSIKNHKYWEKRGIKCDKPVPFLGNFTKGFLMLRSITQIAVDMYCKYPNEKVVGFFRGTRPELVVRDPEIVKRILITDFSYFHPRGLNTHKKVIEPLMRNLFLADGDMWKLLRKRITPTFSSGKLKAMFPLIVERAERLKVRTLDAAADHRTLDARDLMARYTTDFIGACTFGLDSNSLNEEDSEFRKLGVRIFKVQARDVFVAVLKQFFPELCKNLVITSEIERELKKFVGEILKSRNYQITGRGDFLDLLLECKNKGHIVGESIENKKADGTPEEATLVLDDDLIVAQLFVFFAAGFETSSSSMSFALHQLAYHPEAQKKCQEEIDRVLAKYDNKLCYDAIRELNYLEMVFKEAMRMLPSVGVLFRKSARPYTFPELGLTIDEGVGIVIPLQALHNDPQYFDNPDEFRPERFLMGEFDDIKKYVYLPFGDGPRGCVGARLGLMQSLAGLAAVLSCVSVQPGPETRRHPEVNSRSSFVQTIRGGLPLMFTNRLKI